MFSKLVPCPTARCLSAPTFWKFLSNNFKDSDFEFWAGGHCVHHNRWVLTHLMTASGVTWLLCQWPTLRRSLKTIRWNTWTSISMQMKWIRNLQSLMKWIRSNVVNLREMKCPNERLWAIHLTEAQRCRQWQQRELWVTIRCGYVNTSWCAGDKIRRDLMAARALCVRRSVFFFIFLLPAATELAD